MNDLRSKIDLIDKDIQSLLDKRISLVEEIGFIKKDNNLSIRNLEREEEIINSILYNEKVINKKEIIEIYKSIFDISVAKEEEVYLKNKNEARCFLIGKNISYSLSKFIHQKFGYSYDILDFENKEQVYDFLIKKNFIFCNVTTPYKNDVIEYLDELDPISVFTKSVNLIVNKSGKLIGYNTDYLGFLDAMHNKKFNIKGNKFVLLGDGATASTIYRCLKDNGASEINIISRKGRNNYYNITNFKSSDYLINATTVGSERCIQKIVDLEAMDVKKGVIDINYSPVKSQLLIDAERLSIPYMNGLSMLYYQAFHSSIISNLLNNNYPNKDDIMNFIALKRANIVLIGMPASGKTYLGKKLASKYNSNFLDLDAEIEKLLGMSIKEIFNNFGEAYFRLLESFLIREIFSKKRGYVISLGGGAIINEDNFKALKNNAIFVNIINNDIPSNEELNKRPIFKNITYNELLKMRLPVYASIADIEYINDKKNDVDEILKLIDRKIWEIHN